jgi:hypothetical protein
MGAAFAALCSLAYAKAAEVPHGGSGGGFAHSGFQHEGRSNVHAYGARAERGAPAQRNMRVTNGTGGPRGGFNAQQRVAGAGAYRAENRGDTRSGFQYAGAITPVSAETHSVPRPPEDETLVRAGSIRADVARYNEERGAPSRQVPRPPEYMGRPQGPSPYRN